MASDLLARFLNDDEGLIERAMNLISAQKPGDPLGVASIESNIYELEINYDTERVTISDALDAFDECTLALPDFMSLATSRHASRTTDIRE